MDTALEFLALTGQTCGMFKSLSILVLGTILLSALLTPWVYSGIHLLYVDFRSPFSRVYDRTAMLVALVILLVVRRSFSLEYVRTYLRGFNLKQLALLIGGSIVTFASSLIVLPYFVDTGIFVWTSNSSSWLVLKLLRTYPAALLISLIEESFFRVVLLINLYLYFARRRNSSSGSVPNSEGGRIVFANSTALILAIILSSSIYAVVHFITPLKSFEYTSFDPLAGLSYLIAVGNRLISAGVAEAFVGLFLVGVVLALAMVRSGSIWLCIGLHAGWVLALKNSLYATEVAAGYVFPDGLGRRYFLVSEPRTWYLIVLVGLVVSLVASRFRSTELACRKM